MDCKVSFLGQSYRFLQVNSHRCLIKIYPPSSNILEPLLNAKNTTGQTILHHLPSSVTSDIVQQLIDRGADPSLLNHQGCSTLFTQLYSTIPWSVLQQIFEHVVHTNPDLLNVQTPDGTTLLNHAASLCNLQAVQFLLNHNANQFIQDKNGGFPLYNAVMFRSISVVTALVEHDPSVVNVQRSDTWETPLFAAAVLNNVEMVQLFLDSGADCTLRDKEGFTVVGKAVGNGCRDTLQVILEHGRRNGIDVTNNVAPLGMSALHVGLMKDDVETFRTVMEFLVGGAIDENLEQASLVRLRELLLMNNYLLGFTILTAATSAESHKIVAYLREVIELYKKMSGEDLDVGAVPTAFGMSQDAFLSSGDIGRIDGVSSGEVPGPDFLNQILELKKYVAKY